MKIRLGLMENTREIKDCFGVTISVHKSLGSVYSEKLYISVSVLVTCKVLKMFHSKQIA